MKEKKNIDNIFNEGLKNFEPTPSPRVWENIQAELNKEKKERKVIPLWMKLGSIAAMLALLLTVGNSLFNSPETIFSPEITNEDINQSEKELQENKSRSGVEESIIDSQVASDENDSFEEDKSSQNKSDTNSSDLPSNTKGKSTNTVIAAKETSKEDLIENKNSKNNIKERIATTSETSNGPVNSEGKINSEKNKENILSREKDVFTKEKDEIAANNNSENSPNKTKDKNSEIISADKKENTSTAKTDLNNKKSIFDEIAEKDEVAISERKRKEKPEHRWNIAPNVAPVYYSSLGNGSSIDPSFTDNPQKGDVNMSYGVQVSYALSNRLSVRAGVNNVDLSYSTSDIVVGTGPVSTALRSVNYGGKQIVTTAIPRAAFNSNGSNGHFGGLNLKSTQGEALLIQNINYYEVPVELKFSILNSKLGVNLIGGVSTLFLGNNEISVKADNFNTVLGEANNLSDVSFTTNVGLGLDYKLSKKFTFNIEPMFKYQLNPYTDSSVNFKPYYLGVYSGLSFKF